MHDSNCIFCKIVKREIPSTIVYEDDAVIAFNDIAPLAPIHILVIPKKHYNTLMEIAAGEGEFERIFAAVQKIAQKSGISEEGFRTTVNCGKLGGQVVGHVHFHLLGGRQMSGKLG